MKKIMCALCAIALTGIVFAQNRGGGSGGGNNPLTLVSASIKDGQTAVALNAAFEFVFSNNVASAENKAANSKCFLLVDENNIQIPIEVILADDQVNPELKETVVVKAVGALKAEKTYTLTIDGALKAKNGNSLNGKITIRFTTVK